MIRPPEPDDLRAFTGRIVELLEDCEVPYAICGSMAAMEYSEPRLSIDVDLMVLIETDQLLNFTRTVADWGYYVTPPEVIFSEMIPLGRPFNVIDGSSGARADIYPVTPTGLAGSAMQRRSQRTWDLRNAQTAWFLSAEDVILYKLRQYRAGGEVAQKHPIDIIKMLAAMATSLDTAYITRWASELAVSDLWQRLWEQHRQA
jgi:hypothetical protein